MSPTRIRCLILACGNTLRSDDGIGACLADWAEKQFESNPRVRVISRHQWTPDLAADIASADSVLFIDCSIATAPGEILLTEAHPAVAKPGLATHHTGAPELLALAQRLYGSTPRNSLLLTIGAGSTELGETFSPAVTVALPEACRLLEETIRDFLA